MDSVKSEILPIEINRCNVLYKDQEFYSKSVSNNNYKEYNTNKNDKYIFLFSSIVITIICSILIYNAKIKYKEKKSIMLYIIIIIILFISIMCSTLSMLISTNIFDGLNYIKKPSDLTRPCYSSRMNAILYSDEQLRDIYNK
jgi:hypothetical protein